MNERILVVDDDRSIRETFEQHLARSGYEATTAPLEVDEPTEADDSEVGPAPVFDPSAYLPTKPRFIQTNLDR